MGEYSCAQDMSGFTCTATCLSGYQFENKAQSVKLTCDDFNGTWLKGRTFPQCLPICSPNCLNGGTCKTPNFCACPREFRGPVCQFSTSLCPHLTLPYGEESIVWRTGRLHTV
ncbi:protein kinase C-binding protein NELL2-like [Liolophura sinensis]|uniref:protein kinase C-binding protein NELL2-like n=1 Tax=Liolophura sinensis TaxID=3198878 RepID=UPI0031587160